MVSCENRTFASRHLNCAGSTRNDTAILHPWLLQHAQSMQVSTDIIFEPHSPLCIDFQFFDDHVADLSWKLPRSWAAFSPDKQLIHDAYIQVDFDAIEHKFQHDPCKLIDSAFSSWSGAVESVVDKALNVAHQFDPVRNVHSSLHASFKGRCKFEKKFSENKKSFVKSDRHGGYMIICHLAKFLH